METSIACPKCHKELTEPPNFCPACGEDLRGLTPMSDTLSGSWSGKVIDGRYRIREKLGEGGMGTVYKVEHVRMGKVLALKVLRKELVLDKKLKSRFQQEARVVSRLSHPNTIQVFDFGELEDGSLFLAMEYLPGRDLAATLRAHGALSEERAVSIGIQVLSSLGEAHEQGIIHRDIKPANLMLLKRKGGEDVVKVLDFGIAKLNEGESRKHITGVADFVGTPSYMSPEQAQGDPLDSRSDLYAVGALLFELVTGRPVFTGPTPMSVVTQHVTRPPPRLAEAAPGKAFTPAFEAVLRKALAKDRQERYASAEEMLKALERARGDLGFTTSELTPIPEESGDVARREDFDRFERSLRMRRTLVPMLVLGLLALAGLQGWRYLQRSADAVLTAEVEPNDDLAHANHIALGQPVTGKIGAPLSDKDSDRDLFVVDVPRAMPVTVQLSGVEDMNLVMELTQAGEGEHAPPLRVFIDDAPTGRGERVDAFAARPGKLYVRVEERYHFTESPRRPRETTRAEYTLTVSPTPEDGPLEVEPNDTLETATRVRAGQVVTGFTGADVPYDATWSQQDLSTADFFTPEEESASTPTSVVVVPPPAGKLAVVDAAEFASWRRQLAAWVEGRPRPVRPGAAIVSGKPELLALSGSPRGRAVRIQPVPGTAPGSPYLVAFATDQADGLAGVIALMNRLEAAGRATEARKVVRLVERAFPQSSQLAELKALRSGTSASAPEPATADPDPR